MGGNIHPCQIVNLTVEYLTGVIISLLFSTDRFAEMLRTKTVSSHVTLKNQTIKRING